MNELFKKKPHREPLELQLTAMIDIFSMMVIFLIFGTVIGAAEMIFPKDVNLPLSHSKESTESAPQVIISQDRVYVSFPKNVEIPITTFTGDPDDPGLASFTSSITDYVSKMPEGAKKAGMILNIIADKNLSYRNLFNVVKVFRSAGFETMLFITQEAGARSGAR